MNWKHTALQISNIFPRLIDQYQNSHEKQWQLFCLLEHVVQTYSIWLLYAQNLKCLYTNMYEVWPLFLENVYVLLYQKLLTSQNCLSHGLWVTTKIKIYYELRIQLIVKILNEYLKWVFVFFSFDYLLFLEVFTFVFNSNRTTNKWMITNFSNSFSSKSMERKLINK